MLTKSTAGFGSSCSHRSSLSVRRIFSVAWVMQQGEGSRRNLFWELPWAWCGVTAGGLFTARAAGQCKDVIWCDGVMAVQHCRASACGCCQGGRQVCQRMSPKASQGMGTVSQDPPPGAGWCWEGGKRGKSSALFISRVQCCLFPHGLFQEFLQWHP